MKTYEIKRLSSSIFDLFYRLLSLLFWVLIIFGFDTPYVAILTLLSAAVHEVGHIAAILILSGDLRIPDSRVNGMRISLRMKSYTQEIIIAAAGPCANLFCAFILLMFPKSEYTTVFVVLNVFTVASNLLPTEGSDGYRIIKSIIDMRSVSYSPFFLDFLCQNTKKYGDKQRKPKIFHFFSGKNPT